MNRARRWLLSLLVLLFCVAVPELCLRALGFHYESGIQFGFPRPAGFTLYEPDEQLFWKLRPPGRPDEDRPYMVGNSMGFPGPEPERPKPAGVERLLFLGDSCTYQGWPHDAAATLSGEGAPTEAVLLALPGYSSHQGRVAAELYARALEPDLGFVFFGWNDHWTAYRSTDAEKVVRVDRSPAGRIVSEARHLSRLVQAAGWVRDRVSGSSSPLEKVRVPPEQYRANLARIHAILVQAGTPVVFLTAPTSFYSLGVPAALIDLGFAPDGETAALRHRRYNQIVRDVARETGAALIDLEAECEARPDVSRLFSSDGIHCSEEGGAWLAARVADLVRQRRAARGAPAPAVPREGPR